MGRNGRPATSSWTAILNYWELDDEGNPIGKGKTLLNHNATDSTKKLYWENQADALRGLEELQIDKPIKYVIFIKVNDAEFLMEPIKQLTIKYNHHEDKTIERVEEKEEVKVLEKKDTELPDIGGD